MQYEDPCNFQLPVFLFLKQYYVKSTNYLLLMQLITVLSLSWILKSPQRE